MHSLLPSPAARATSQVLMERRRSLPRTAASPLSDHNTSPLRRKSLSLSPSNNSSSSSKQLPSPRRLHKHPSSDEIQLRLLWPSSKTPSTYDVDTTFSSRQRASEDGKEDWQRRSLRHHIGKVKKKTETSSPSSPCCSSTSSSSASIGRFSLSEAKKRSSDLGVDLGSTGKGKSGGGGVGSLISQGLSSLFRRRSFQEGSSPGRERGVGSSPGREARGCGSPGRERGAVEGEVLQFKLRLLHNCLVQWRFVNAGMAVVNQIKRGNAERTLVNAWLGLTDLRSLVTKKRGHLEKEKLKFKLNTLVCHQTKALETWGTMERQHLAALSSTKDSLQAAVCRLPITDQAKVDPHLLTISLRQATNIATAINGNIAKCHSRAQSTGPLVAELSQVVAREKLLLEECIELLGLVSTLQVHEESLRSNIIQLKSQHLTRCAAQGPSCWIDD